MTVHSKTLKTINQVNILLSRSSATETAPGTLALPGAVSVATVLEDYFNYAKDVFKVGKGSDPVEEISAGSYGFIYTTGNSDIKIQESNSHCSSPSCNSDIASPHFNNNSFNDFNIYGYESLYYKISSRINFQRINTIKELKSGKKRLYAYDLGLLEEKEVYHWFNELVFSQNNSSFPLKNKKSGEVIFLYQGRFCNRKGKRSAHVQNIFKQGIGEISDCILLTLSTHQAEVIKAMNLVRDTNLLPVQFATVNIGKWISRFIDALRKYQARNAIPWTFVGWTLEFQENGYPHVHMIFKGKWIGDIQKIASLWAYCELQGVDYMNKAKYERKLIKEGKLSSGRHVSGIRLINYITAYVSKCSRAVNLEGVHKGYAWLAFSGGRLFNVAREYKKQREVKDGCSDWVPLSVSQKTKGVQDG